MDAIVLARIQFAFTIAFHIIFPSLSIGLSAYIATLEAMWLKTGNDRYHLLARFWTKVFAVSFAMGVVSGIVMSYQFGTNWSRFSVVVGNVIGPLIGYEVLTAFFLEGTFLGVMLFGWNRVPKGLHFAASVIVAVGTTISAFWILSANSWMHAPVGFEMREGIAYPKDWLQIVFNPTFPLRLAHMVSAAYLTTAFVVLAVGAGYVLVGRFAEEGKTMLRMAIGFAAVLAPAQLLIGDAHGLVAAKYQPAKIAAVEAHWEGERAAPLVLFAVPNAREEKNDFEISIPNVASLIITHEWDGKFKGLKDFDPKDRPPVAPVFYAFRVMVGIGMLMILVALAGAWLWWRGRLFESRRYLYIASKTWPLGFIAIITGWIVAEVGRQPWIATGVLRTADAASPVSANQVALSLALFVLVYGVVFSTGIYYMNRMLRKGPQLAPHTIAETPLRPISAAHDLGAEALKSTE
jgi:cytochrome bd ubiquinol oxidase subunit I